jgi:outer membrane protein TolC
LLDLDKLRAGTSNLLKQEGLETKALENAPSVRQAEASVQEAAQNLRTIKQEARPSVALRVSYDGSRGWGLRLDLNHGFFKNFDLQIREAEQALALAQRTLESARETARLEIYSRRDVLRDAQNQMELFSMKQALLRLQEEMRQKQLEGGLLSTDTWEEFLIQKKEFESDYQKAISDLCVSYFEYEKSLGMNLNLEEVILP